MGCPGSYAFHAETDRFSSSFYGISAPTLLYKWRTHLLADKVGMGTDRARLGEVGGVGNGQVESGWTTRRHDLVALFFAIFVECFLVDNEDLLGTVCRPVLGH